MSIEKSRVNSGQQGNALVIVLVVLIVAAVGALAFMSGKMGNVPAAGEAPAQVAQTQTPADPATPEQTDPVVARVDGADIKRSEVVQMVNMMPPQMQQIPLEQLLPIAIEQLVNNKIVDKQSAGANLGSDPEVVRQLALAKEQIVRAKFVENAVTKEISEDRLKAKYQDYVKNFPDVEEVKAAHILVDKEDKAKDVIKQLGEGKAFADLAKENSKDNTAQNGGELGYFTKQDVVAPFAEAAFATKVGEYTKKPVKTEFGFHIIKIDDLRKRPPAEYEQAKGFLDQEVRREILEEVFKKWRDSAKIERFDINGNPLPEKQEPAAGEQPAAPAPAAAPAAAPTPAPAAAAAAAAEPAKAAE